VLHSVRRWTNGRQRAALASLEVRAD
jgi:hypothetical protein